MPSPTELWRYQRGGTNSDDGIRGASAAADRSVFLAGQSSGVWNGTSAGEGDFSGAKIDSNGALLWAWQEGSEKRDAMSAAATVADGGVVFAGHSPGSWNGVASKGNHDFAAVKLDSEGSVLWRWQAGSSDFDYLHACVETTDGNVVVAGASLGSINGVKNEKGRDMVAVKLNVSTGEEIWTSQVGTEDGSGAFAWAAAARADGSIVLAGQSLGTFANALATTEGNGDFAAVAIDVNGEELWRWQAGPDAGNNKFFACTALEDGSVLLAGKTEGDWDGANNGMYDFAMVKLNAVGLEEWRWQGGTDVNDEWAGAATRIDGSIVLAGYTEGNWTGAQRMPEGGTRDFAAMAMDENGLQLWRYQDGTDSDDVLTTVTVRSDGAILMAGSTNGIWTTRGNVDEGVDYAAVLIDGSVLTTPSPEGLISRKPGQSGVQPLSTFPTSALLGKILGFVASGAAALVLFALLVKWARRISREGLRASAVTFNLAGSRHFPSAALHGESAVSPASTDI